MLSREVMPVPPVMMIDLDIRIRELTLDRASHEVGVVFDDGPAGDLVARVAQQIGDRPAGRIRFVRAGVADRDDVATHRARGVQLVLDVTHRIGILDCASAASTRAIHVRRSFPGESFGTSIVASARWSPSYGAPLQRGYRVRLGLRSARSCS